MMLANCVAVPVLDGAGVAIAALSISGPTSRFNPREKRTVDALKEAAARLSDEVGGREAEVNVPAASASVSKASKVANSGSRRAVRV
jgi:transcriptional regulator of acetoin/glycerol metabolism